MNPQNAFIVPKHPDGVLRVIVLGRISTEHQSLDNIEASCEEVERRLKQMYDGPVQFRRFGERGSGWKVNRQSIRDAEAEIQTETWDLVLAEDIGRAWRNPEFQYRLAHLCVDSRTRLICPGDGIDTGLPNWEPILSAAVMRHGMTVPETRRRVRRTADYAFARGGMVTKVRFGYRRVTADEAAQEASGQQGVRMVRDPACTPIILEMRQRVLRGDTYNAVADWLNMEQIPVGPYATDQVWTGKLLRNLLRDPILYGLQAFRKSRFEMLYRTGEYRREHNQEPMTNLIPELAHLTKEDFDSPNEFMDQRVKPLGPHRRRGIIRKHSFWPGQHLRCAICGDLMYWATTRHLKCSHAMPGRPRKCWNQLLVEAALVWEQVLPTVIARLQQQPELFQVLVDAAWKEFDRLQQQNFRPSDSLRQKLRELEKNCQQLLDLLVKRPDNETLLQRFDAAEAERKECEIRWKAAQAEHRRDSRYTSRDDVINGLESAVQELAATSYAFGQSLQRLLPTFEVVPVQALDTPQVHPLVRFVLPAATNGQTATILHFDVFRKSLPISLAAQVIQTRQESPKPALEKIAGRLGTSKKTVCESLKYARLMSERGTDDPFVELSAPPRQASRWRGASLEEGAVARNCEAHRNQHNSGLTVGSPPET